MPLHIPVICCEAFKTRRSASIRQCAKSPHSILRLTSSLLPSCSGAPHPDFDAGMFPSFLSSYRLLEQFLLHSSKLSCAVLLFLLILSSTSSPPLPPSPPPLTSLLISPSTTSFPPLFRHHNHRFLSLLLYCLCSTTFSSSSSCGLWGRVGPVNRK